MHTFIFIFRLPLAGQTRVRSCDKTATRDFHPAQLVDDSAEVTSVGVVHHRGHADSPIQRKLLIPWLKCEFFQVFPCWAFLRDSCGFRDVLDLPLRQSWIRDSLSQLMDATNETSRTRELTFSYVGEANECDRPTGT